MLKTLQKSSNHLLKMPAKVLAANYSTNPQGLPSLPVPKLSDTLAKYLETVEPHLTSERYENTKNLVKEFGKNGGIGEKLQLLLERRAGTKENWLSDPTSNWWLDCAYLQYRDPVVVWSSPGLVFPQKKFVTVDDKIRYASQVIYAALKYRSLINSKKIPVEKFGKNDLDMQQYNKIFGTCRIPGAPQDSLEFHPNSKHIALAVNDVFFKVPVYAQDGSILAENQLQQQIRECLTAAEKMKSSVPVGILTSDNRDNWAKAYQELIKNDENRQALAEVQKSLFVLSIDREMSQIDDDITTACHQLVTGGGSRFNSANRWYDKTIQFVVGSNGINGLTYEHSPAEGGPIAILTDNIIKFVMDQEAGKVQASSGNASCDKPTVLNFQTSSEVDKCIQLAANNIDKLSSDLDMSYLHFTNYGKNFIKSQKFSPDSYIQMAIQFAFYRLHHVPGAHYESAATRIYVHGRTECIRSCSKESIAFAKAMVEGKDDIEKLNCLKAAINSHKKYVTQAVQGHGIDRHLLGLKLIAKENGMPIPEFYSDEGYSKSSSYRLSTSQVASIYDAFMCYGPLTNDGYGCCYSPKNNDMWFGLSSLKSNEITSTKMFKKSLEEALDCMHHLLVKVGEPPIKSKL